MAVEVDHGGWLEGKRCVRDVRKSEVAGRRQV
jgi:hypothetical protein